MHQALKSYFIILCYVSADSNQAGGTTAPLLSPKEWAELQDWLLPPDQTPTLPPPTTMEALTHNKDATEVLAYQIYCKQHDDLKNRKLLNISSFTYFMHSN